MTHDEFYIQKTFELARHGRGFVSPNPMVGAIVVKEGRIIGEGYHQCFGGPHAEVMAIKNCTESPAGATLYCNLEPCCHTNKKTPPCTELLLQSQIKRVVIANIDPNPMVAGKGLQQLQQKGVTTVSGVLAPEGAKLNEIFFTFMSKCKPFVNIKLAQTLDGKMATSTGSSQWITNETLRKEAHKLRSYHDAIVVGSQTVFLDDPSLTVRYALPHREQPWRIVIGSLAKMSFQEKIFTDSFKHKTIAFVPEEEGHLYSKLPIAHVIATPVIEQNRSNLFFILQWAFKSGITSLLIEGGPSLITSFIKNNLADRLTCFTAPKIIGSGRESFQELNIQEMGKAIHFHDPEMSVCDNHFFFTGLFPKK